MFLLLKSGVSTCGYLKIFCIEYLPVSHTDLFIQHFKSISIVALSIGYYVLLKYLHFVFTIPLLSGTPRCPRPILYHFLSYYKFFFSLSLFKFKIQLSITGIKKKNYFLLINLDFCELAIFSHYFKEFMCWEIFFTWPNTLSVKKFSTKEI